MRVLLVALILTGFAWAQERDGGKADIAILQRGVGRPSVVEVRTDPEVTGRGELFYYLIENGGGVTLRGAVPPSAPGLYRFEVSVPKAGQWGLSLRHGVGLELFYAFRWFTLDPAATGAVRAAETFEAELGPEAPRFVQPLGLAIFGVVLLCSLSLVFVVLRWLDRQGGKLQRA